uniref:Putative secreted protein n=1 Tax=Amblyomma triste TaxID=251400 RepID=A0A023G4E9_AMBTT
MEKALFCALLLSISYVHCAPQEAALETAQKTAEKVVEPEYQDFCGVDKSLQLSFLDCVEGKIPLFKDLLEKESLTKESLLDQICSDVEADYPEELKAGMLEQWEDIEECLVPLETALRS